MLVYGKIVIVIATYFRFCAAKNAYQSILTSIFKDYDTGVRPVQNADTTVNEEKVQTIELVSYMELSWTDEHLQWNPVENDNVVQFRYPHDKVWKPDIILTNTPDLNDGPVMKDASTNVIMRHDGTITNSFTAVYKVTCKQFSIVDFPFDKHNCYLEFGSWTYNIEEMDVHHSEYEYDLPESMKFVANSEWDIAVNGYEKVTEWECCPNETYPYLRIHITLTRKPLYYFVHLIIPTILTCYVAFFGMFNPTSSNGDRADKAFLGLCTLFTISLLLLNVSSEMPITSDTVTLMGVFLGVLLIIIAAAVITTCIIMNIHLKWMKGKPVSKWTRKWIIHWLSTWLWLDIAKQSTNDVDNSPVQTRKFKKHSENSLSEDKSSELKRLVEQKFQPVNDVLLKLIEKQMKDDYQQLIQDEWGQLCAVLDRICLIFYVVISTIFSVALFIRFF